MYIQIKKLGYFFFKKLYEKKTGSGRRRWWRAPPPLPAHLFLLLLYRLAVCLGICRRFTDGFLLRDDDVFFLGNFMGSRMRSGSWLGLLGNRYRNRRRSSTSVGLSDGRERWRAGRRWGRPARQPRRLWLSRRRRGTTTSASVCRRRLRVRLPPRRDGVTGGVDVGGAGRVSRLDSCGRTAGRGAGAGGGGGCGGALQYGNQ